MRVFTNRTPIATGLPFEVADLQLHIRTDEDGIERYGQTAAAELEHFAQVALLHQRINLTILAPDDSPGVHLPIGPSYAGNVPTVKLDAVPFTGFDFYSGKHPQITWQPSYFDAAPSLVEIEYEAGFGTQASDVPPDLVQALLDQAALHFDGRSPMDGKSLTTSPHMARVGARYRGVKL